MTSSMFVFLKTILSFDLQRYYYRHLTDGRGKVFHWTRRKNRHYISGIIIYVSIIRIRPLWSAIWRAGWAYYFPAWTDDIYAVGLIILIIFPLWFWETAVNINIIGVGESVTFTYNYRQRDGEKETRGVRWSDYYLITDKWRAEVFWKHFY